MWQQKIAQRVRDIAHAADAEVAETIKRSNRPYFVLHGNICALLGAKDHLNIFIYDPIVPAAGVSYESNKSGTNARRITGFTFLVPSAY